MEEKSLQEKEVLVTYGIWEFIYEKAKIMFITHRENSRRIMNTTSSHGDMALLFTTLEMFQIQ